MLWLNGTAGSVLFIRCNCGADMLYRSVGYGALQVKFYKQGINQSSHVLAVFNYFCVPVNHLRGWLIIEGRLLVSISLSLGNLYGFFFIGAFFSLVGMKYFKKEGG